jgi:hypothetical protein
MKAMSFWRRLADARIVKAMADGAFENLSGAGMPLRLEENPLADPSMRLAHHVLKNADISPHWLTLKKEIQDEIAEVRDRFVKAVPECRGESESARRIKEDLLARIEAINARVALYNLIVPHCAFQIPALDGDWAIHRYRPGEAE